MVMIGSQSVKTRRRSQYLITVAVEDAVPIARVLVGLLSK